LVYGTDIAETVKEDVDMRIQQAVYILPCYSQHYGKHIQETNTRAQGNTKSGNEQECYDDSFTYSHGGIIP
jgi:hypothetical protein